MYELIGLDMFLFGFINLCLRFLVAKGFVICFLVVSFFNILLLLLFFLYVLKYGRTSLFSNVWGLVRSSIWFN